MKSISVADVLSVGLVAGAGVLTARKLKKKSTAVRVVGTAAAVAGTFIVSAFAGFMLSNSSGWWDQEIIRWNASKAPGTNAWIKLGAHPPYFASRTLPW